MLHGIAVRITPMLFLGVLGLPAPAHEAHRHDSQLRYG
jgi:hypothetical protein